MKNNFEVMINTFNKSNETMAFTDDPCQPFSFFNDDRSSKDIIDNHGWSE